MLAGMAGLPLLSLKRAHAGQDETNAAYGVETGNAIMIIATDFAFGMPRHVQAGLVTMTLLNEGEKDHAAQIIRLNDGVLVPDVTTALQDGLGSSFSLVSLMGGPGHTPSGGHQTVVQELSPGKHMVIDTVVNEQGIPQFLTGIPRPFDVVESADFEEEPTAVEEIRMLDFSIEGFPAELTTGRHVWRVTTEGQEPHELGFRSLDKGVTADMVIDMIEAYAAGTPEVASPFDALTFMTGLPLANAGGIQAMDPGSTGWMVVDLEPGEYLAVCMVPSPDNDWAPHASLGMMQGFTVTAA
jgi:hypothetical protein